MAYTKINTFAGAASSQSTLDADTSALRTAVNAVATSDLSAAAAGSRHFVEPKSHVFQNTADGPLVTISWDSRGFGEHMFAVLKGSQAWSGFIAQVRNRRDYYIRSMPYPRSVTIGTTPYWRGIVPITAKRIRLGDKGGCAVKVFCNVAHALMQNYASQNTTTRGYPGTAKEANAGYFVLCYKEASSSSWQQIPSTTRHVWASDDDFQSYRAVCTYNVSAMITLAAASDYDIALCYVKVDTTDDLEQLIIGPCALTVTAYHKV